MIDFDDSFKLLTKKPPFAWQRSLYERFLADKIPDACDIPTGLGKTSVITIWLLALAEKLLENPAENKIPRRLVYVVDRRVIVDQATKEAEKVLKRVRALSRLSAMNEKHSDLRGIFEVLKSVSFLRDEKNLIALSTLRGEFADNREWCLDPARPAIIVGTIDMIGSRLLFSAYGGVGESYKALQAGLLGQDSLVVIDEAHLSPAFMQMLRPLQSFVNRKNEIKRFQVMSLSATLADEEAENLKKFTLEDDAPEDLQNEVAEPRLNAEKKIEWHRYQVAEDILKSKKAVESVRDEQAKEMAKVAARYKDLPVSVLIFGATVDLVKKIRKYLIETEKIDTNQVLQMIGGMRGFERDELVKHEIFKQFDPNRIRGEKDKASFLVATSVAEVGVNLDADFAVCDLTAADSFVQRIGRVNRFGKTSSVVTIVYNEKLEDDAEPEKFEHESAQAKATFLALKAQENGASLNASPLILRGIKFPPECYLPKPVSPPLDAARIDDWAMTSLKQNDFRRPLVSYWLRGVTVDNKAETSLCWRADFRLITENEKLTGIEKKDKVIEKRIEKKLIATVKTVRVKSRECARESTGRAEKTILAVAEKFPAERAVIISAGNDYEVTTLADLAGLKEQNGKNELFPKLMFATVILPCEVGGLEKGIAVDDSKQLTLVDDVVEKPQKEIFSKRNDSSRSNQPKAEWLRLKLVEVENGWKVERINGDENLFADKTYESFNDAVSQIAKAENRKSVKHIDLGFPGEAEDEEESPKKRKLAYLISKKSPEANLPNEGEADDETEDESASIGFTEDASKKFDGEVTVEKHNRDVALFAKQLAEKLYLNLNFVEALEIAGARHDKGKNRKCWQSAVGNTDLEKPPLAKSKQTWFNFKLNDYYRHEFGSLVEAESDEALTQNPNRDLILHLIAAHHGYARPHFPERAFDRENPTGENREIAMRAMQRFAQLQIRYGWWQLAYLEAILKAADALASRAEAKGEI